MRIHFIAIGGAVMHNLAIALQKNGHEITGSDDNIFEPSRSRLRGLGLLPEWDGWNPDVITGEIDIVILGMHARTDNPELLRSIELGIKVMSFPEYLYEQTKEKKRIVIGGSHGKTTTTAMIMHVFRECGIKFDYMVGSAISGFETMVGISPDSQVAVFEGDEYLSSPIDRRPKFLLYNAHIAVINGIAWDHINVFPTYEEYVEQFRLFAAQIPHDGTLIYFDEDPEVRTIANTNATCEKKIAYRTHGYFRNKIGFFAATQNRVIPMKVFGAHNMQNLSAAKEVCMASGIDETDFYRAISTFEGAGRRLQLMADSEKATVYFDFAHAPSKVKSTVEAVEESYEGRPVIAILELHTFSSLNAAFLPQYQGTLDKANKAFVYFNPEAIKHKKLLPVAAEDIKSAFGGDNITVYSDSKTLFRDIEHMSAGRPVYLIMSSGDFDGHNIEALAGRLAGTEV